MNEPRRMVEDFDGFSNGATWSAVLHFRNTSLAFLQEARAAAAKGPRDLLAVGLKTWGKRTPEGYPTRDVNWGEAARALLGP